MNLCEDYLFNHDENFEGLRDRGVSAMKYDIESSPPAVSQCNYAR